MTAEIPPRSAAKFSAYHKLVSDYRDAVKRCEEQLDELSDAERQLREYTEAMNGAATPYTTGAFDALRSELANLSGMGPPTGQPGFSVREGVVFELIGQGRTTQQIAAQLSLAVSTVETYRERIKQKLNLPSANALVREAVLWVASPASQRKQLRSGIE